MMGLFALSWVSAERLRNRMGCADISIALESDASARDIQTAESVGGVAAQAPDAKPDQADAA